MERYPVLNTLHHSYEVDSPSDSGDVLTYSDEEIFSNLSTPTSVLNSADGLRSFSMDDHVQNEMLSDASDQGYDSDFIPPEESLSSPNSYSSDTSEELQTKSKKRKSHTYVPVHKDGYKWRKYGQKHVKGNSYPRNYYKCTVPDCPAKKHIELIVDKFGNEKESIEYVNDHIHPAPNSSKINVKSQEEFKLVVQTHSKQFANECVSKKKKGYDLGRCVVECEGDIDFSNDGYTWKKYGQKNIKGAYKPRQYYKCTFPNCNVKKQVESLSCTHTIVTYNSCHSHPPKEVAQIPVKKDKEENDVIENLILSEEIPIEMFNQQNMNEVKTDISSSSSHNDEQSNLYFQSFSLFPSKKSNIESMGYYNNPYPSYMGECIEWV